MTTGDPLIVTGAMKPLPDADEAAALGRHRDEGAGAGAPRAHRLVHGARRRRGGRGDGRARARGRLPREVRRRPHRRRRGARSARTRTGSVGGAHERARLRRLHGRRQVDRAPARSRAELGVEPLDSDHELERELGEPIESFFDRDGEAAFRAREEELVLELLGARGRAGARARRRRARVRARARGARARTPSSTSRSSRRRRGGARPGKGRPLARDRGRFEQLHGDAAPSTSRWPTPCCRPATATRCGGRCPALGRSESAPRRHPARVGVGGVRRVPGLLRHTA